MSKIILAGGSGFIGHIFADHFVAKGDEVVILSRNPEPGINGVKSIFWDGQTLGDWVEELNHAEILINLSGKSVNCRYTEENKALILSSRINATRVLGEALRRIDAPPRTWINCASATIYRHAEDCPQDEETGTGFSVDVCKAWEDVFFASKIKGIRQIVLRIAIVLGSNGGVLPYFLNLSRFGLGGIQGNGKQYFSWIHEDDLTGIIDFLMLNEQISGVINVSSPNPVQNVDLMKAFRNATQVPFGLPATKWMLEIGTWLLRTESELLLKSRWVVPSHLLSSGYIFKVPSIDQAVQKCMQ